MKHVLPGIIYSGALILLFASCDQHAPPDNNTAANQEMISLLATVAKNNYTYNNPFCSQARVEYYTTALNNAIGVKDSTRLEFMLAHTLLELGQEQKAVDVGEHLLTSVKGINAATSQVVMKNLAMAYLRLGERENCVMDHSGASCIFPISGRGIQRYKRGSEKAIELYEQILQREPEDVESRWLLNIAYMVIGKYPRFVPAAFLIPGLDSDTSSLVKPFTDLAVNTGLNTENMAGGSIIEDFDNDGNLDLVTSSWALEQGMHFCRNRGDGNFTDVSDSSRLRSFTGGLNMMQTDYNNDGLKDIFVLRGGWMREYGNQPNSLLKNNGDGTFTDVTKESGLLSFHPTQTATWADFNGDGWLDVFIGNESAPGMAPHPCELYMNNKNGTFTEAARTAGCDLTLYVKGVSSGDFDNDGMPDICVSTLNGKKVLLRNQGEEDGTIRFKDVSREAGLGNNLTRTFTTWFWDYDNDGWLDILFCGYQINQSLAWYAGREALHLPVGNAGNIFVYHNLHNGSFEEVSNQLGLNKVVFAMGANFGDINNDGYPDMYFGTGNPVYQSLVPNKMFLNMGGSRFADVTSSARLGNLQKGHGVSFADLDNDGDQDIYIEMGGAYSGDAYQNSLYINPGQNDNHWINISLEGTRANRAAIGAKLKVTFAENGKLRFVYRELNSGGSFGSNPLMQHIGTGQAIVIKSIEINWPGSNTVQKFNNILTDQHIVLKEESNEIATVMHKRVDFILAGKAGVGCAPNIFSR